MPFLSPAKLLVILVIALVVLGPDKLPKMAKQIGALWADFRRFRERLESEVRSNLPDLPSTETITQAVRSPLSFLDNLPDSHQGRNAARPPESGPASSVHLPEVVLGPSAGGLDRVGSVEISEEPISGPDFVAEPGGVAHHLRSTGEVLPAEAELN